MFEYINPGIPLSFIYLTASLTISLTSDITIMKVADTISAYIIRGYLSEMSSGTIRFEITYII